MQKLNRRAALGLMAVASGIVASDVMIMGAPSEVQPMPQVRLNVDMDRFEGFDVTYKGKTQHFTTEQVMDALFGSGSFGNENPELVNYIENFIARGERPTEIQAKPAQIKEFLEWCRINRIYYGANPINYMGIPITPIV
jgi:hypothetical protein